MAQVLIKLHQYNRRLAAFWEFRAVAVEISESFGNGERLAFDHLVQALSPDSVNFRPMPKPTALDPGEPINPSLVGPSDLLNMDHTSTRLGRRSSGIKPDSVLIEVLTTVDVERLPSHMAGFIRG